MDLRLTDRQPDPAAAWQWLDRRHGRAGAGDFRR
jgi:hypothetical protein